MSFTNQQKNDALRALNVWRVASSLCLENKGTPRRALFGEL
jgi:hypothetical protein